MEERVNNHLPLAARIAREFSNIPSLEKNIAATIDKAPVRNPKDLFSAAGKLLAGRA